MFKGVKQISNIIFPIFLDKLKLIGTFDNKKLTIKDVLDNIYIVKFDSESKIELSYYTDEDSDDLDNEPDELVFLRKYNIKKEVGLLDLRKITIEANITYI